MGSAVGEMHEYRQHILDHILENYAEPVDGVVENDRQYFSHMLVLDLDLDISISPLGLMHSLGRMPNNVVASSGRVPYGASLGTIIPPYDFNAFRATPTRENTWIRSLHQSFCNLKPEDDRWGFYCNAFGSFHMMQILMADRGQENFYQ